MKKEIVKFDDVKSVMQFLKQPTIKIAEALTGILASDLKDWKLSAGKIVQALIKGNLLTQIGREIERYQKEGKIKEDYLESDLSRASLNELLKFIDEETPDEIRFRAVKSIFLTSIDGSDEILAYECLQTAKKLSGTEILILKANFDLVVGKMSDAVPKENLGNAQSKRSAWKRVIAKQMGYGDLHAMVTKYERNLESLGLISPRGDDTRFPDEFEPTQKYRLTEVGYRFCEFMTRYD